MNNQRFRSVCVCEQTFSGHTIFEKIISLDNLFSAWLEFKKGKDKKPDVQHFFINLEDNLFQFHDQLKNNIYKHAHYSSFYINDPKLRHIHKAKVTDRIVHHAVIQVLEPLFDKTFIYDSYSSRKSKGSHKAVERLRYLAWSLSANNTQTVWALKCDIRKFFDSVDHSILISLMRNKIADEKAMQLIEKIIDSFHTQPHRGIPLGNVTSQLFSNMYLNPLDHYIKRQLRIKRYLRYADDFVILNRNQCELQSLIQPVERFLATRLNLQLHPQKVIIRKWRQGIDFLGYISFPHYTILRTKTKKRMYRKIKEKHHDLKRGFIEKNCFRQTLASYLGVLRHCRSYDVTERIKALVGYTDRRLMKDK